MQGNAKVWILCASLGLSGCSAKAVEPQPNPGTRTNMQVPDDMPFDYPRGNGTGSAGQSGKAGGSSTAGAAGAAGAADVAGRAGAGGAAGTGVSLAGGAGSPSAGAAGANPVTTADCSSLTRARLKDGTCVDRVVEFSVATNPTNIVSGSDGKIWFDDGKANQLVQMDTQGRALNALGCEAGSGRALVTGKGDAILWYTDPESQRVTELTKDLERVPIELGFTPLGLSLGEGDQLWLTELNQAAYRVNPFDSTKKRWLGAATSTIVVGPDHNLWFPSEGAITRLIAAGETEDFAIGDNYADDLCAGPDGALWFTDGPHSQIGRMEVDGSFSIKRLTQNIHPGRIIAGPDHALWFTEEGVEKIGRITVNAEVTHYPTPSTNGFIYDLTVGPDGNIWFTKTSTGKIGRLIVDAVE